MKNKLYLFLSGILIGICMILPGVSGSVVAIMLGIYEEIIFLLNSNKKNITKIKTVFPLMIGMSVGVFIFGKILLFFYNKYTFYVLYMFIGLILGSIPILIREVHEKNLKIEKKYLLLSMFISLILFFMPKIFNFEIQSNHNFLNLFFGGLLYSLGKIVPGISSSFFLMALGLYEYLLKFITDPFNITLDGIINIIPFVLGLIFGIYFFIKIINFLLNNRFRETYSSIIGFILGSIFSIYPGIEFSIKGALAFAILLISFQFVNIFSKKT